MGDVQYVDLDGDRVAYRAMGAGEVIVLIHGMAGNSATWEAILPQLSERHRVIAPDLLGHGLSAKPRTDYSLGAFAAKLRDLLDALGISSATVVGHSLGGGVAMQFLYQHPEYCRRLILISSGGLGPDVGWILRLLAAPGAEFALPVIAPKLVLNIGNRMRSWLGEAGIDSPRVEQIWQSYSSLSDQATRGAFLRTLRSVVDYRGQSVSALNRLGLRSEVPTLVIWGERDQIIPVEHGYAVQSARPNSQLKVLDGLGHFPHVESPAEVVTAIDDFIAGSHSTKNQEMQSNSWSSPPPVRFGTSAESETTDDALRTMVDKLESRREIDTAIGVLMVLRKCPPSEAFSDFISAVHESGIAPDSLGRALVNLAGGEHDSSPQHVEAQRRWGHLLALRGLDRDSTAAAVHDSVRIRYGPENESMIC